MSLERGDIVELTLPSIGFARPSERRLAVVLQAGRANALLETTIVAPLDAAFDPRAVYPFDVVVPGPEIGAAADHLARVHLLRHVLRSRLGERRAKVGKRTLAQLTRALRLLVG